jgi:signal peptidase I
MAIPHKQRPPTPITTPSPITDVARWTPLVRVHGLSMQPTLEHGQWLLTRRGAAAVGDIVVFTTGRGRRCVKRIVAAPGDVVELEAGRLFVNRQSMDGQPRTAGARVETWDVPDGHFFVVGDNLRQSDDSRVWQEPFVPAAGISGVVVSRSYRRTPG